jgi:hypothetical protein
MGAGRSEARVTIAVFRVLRDRIPCSRRLLVHREVQLAVALGEVPGGQPWSAPGLQHARQAA